MRRKANRKEMHSLGLCAAVLAGCLAASAAWGGEAGFVHPVLRVPKMETAPTIDGVIAEGEWRQASAFTAVSAGKVTAGHHSIVPSVQQVVWHIGYDDTYLYLAMRSPHPKGTYPVARVEEAGINGT